MAEGLVQTGIEAADMLTDYLRQRTTELDSGDAANIISFLHEAGFRASGATEPKRLTEFGPLLWGFDDCLDVVLIWLRAHRDRLDDAIKKLETVTPH